MRRVATIIAISLCASLGLAEPTPPPAAAPTQAAPQTNTEVQGEVPASVAGTWLMIQNATANDRFENSATVYTFSNHDGVWRTVQLSDAKLPNLIAAIKTANKAAKRYTLDEAMLKKVKQTVATLKPAPAAEANRNYVFATPDHLPAEQQGAPELKDAKLTLGIVTSGSGIAGGVTNYIFNVLEHDHISGIFQAGFVAVPSGLPPVPVVLNGQFEMFRLK